MTLIDPRQTVALESGYGLDVIGAMKGVDLPRNGTETDFDYRTRLMTRLWAPFEIELGPIIIDDEKEE